MKTKNALLLCCMILTMSSGIAQKSENYYSYSQRMSRYYDSLRVITPDTLKVAGRRQFQRWNDFWRDRVLNQKKLTNSLILDCSTYGRGLVFYSISTTANQQGISGKIILQ